MNYGVVIPTLGQSGVLRQVLESLAELPTPPQVVAVNDQSGGDEVAALCEEFGAIRTTRRPGLSVARNAAIDAIIGQVEWIALLDDDSVIVNLPELDGYPEASAFAGEYVGRVAAVSDEVFVIDRRTVWTHVIESALIVRSSALGELRFDETLGVGCPTPWQSGEGTDLLYRLMEKGPVVYRPDFQVVELGDDGSAEFPVDKHRRYARGTGRVLRRHGTTSDQVRALVGPVTRVARNPRLHWNVLLGRIEGLIGRTF